MEERRHSAAEMKGSEGRLYARRTAAGFTLAETMVGVFVFGIIMGGLLTLYTMSMLAWKEGTRDVSLQSSGRLMIEKIVRGPGSRFGLREAAGGEVTVDADGKGITFRVDRNNPPTYTRDDDTETRIYLQNNMIMYDPSTAEEGNELPLLSFGRVEDIRFEVNGKVVNIDLRLTETSAATHPSHVGFRATVFLRKSEDPDTET